MPQHSMPQQPITIWCVIEEFFYPSRSPEHIALHFNEDAAYRQAGALHDANPGRFFNVVEKRVPADTFSPRRNRRK